MLTRLHRSCWAGCRCRVRRGAADAAVPAADAVPDQLPPQLVGRGLPVVAVAELIAYSLAYMVTLAVPMAWLIALQAAFGRMAESRGYLVAKSAGVSLVRLAWPALVVGLLLTTAMTYFNNEMLPEANHRMNGLWADIRVSRPGFALTPGEFYTDVSGYAIRADAIPTDSAGLLVRRDRLREPERRRRVLDAGRRESAPAEPVRRAAPDHVAGERAHRPPHARRHRRLRARLVRPLPHGLRPVEPGRLRAPRARRRRAHRPLHADVGDAGRRGLPRPPRPPPSPTPSAPRSRASGPPPPTAPRCGSSRPATPPPPRPPSARAGRCWATSATRRGGRSTGWPRTAPAPSARRPTSRRPRRSGTSSAPTASASRSTRRTPSRWRAWCSCWWACPWGWRCPGRAWGWWPRWPCSCSCSTGSRSCRAEKLADRGLLPPWLGMWAANVIVGVLGVYLVAREARDPAWRDPIRALAGRFKGRG